MRVETEMSRESVEKFMLNTAIVYELTLVNDNYSLEVISGMILDRATRTLCSEMAAVILVQGDGACSTVKSVGILPRHMDRYIEMSGLPVIAELARQNADTCKILGGNEPVVINSIPYGSVLFKAIKTSGNSVLGYLVVGRIWKRCFSDDEIRLYSILSRIAAVSFENIKLREELWHFSITDHLTGMGNYRHFENTVQGLIREAVSAKKTFYLIETDFKHFKKVNDLFGHGAGDQVLVRFADYMKQFLGRKDLCFRIGGDEFITILWNCAEENAEAVMNMIAGFAEQCVPEYACNEKIRFGVNLGYARVPRDGTDLTALMHIADQRMYQDKKRQQEQNASHLCSSLGNPRFPSTDAQIT